MISIRVYISFLLHGVLLIFFFGGAIYIHEWSLEKRGISYVNISI